MARGSVAPPRGRRGFAPVLLAAAALLVLPRLAGGALPASAAAAEPTPGTDAALRASPRARPPQVRPAPAGASGVAAATRPAPPSTPAPAPTRPVQRVPAARAITIDVAVAAAPGAAGTRGAPRAGLAGGPPACDYLDVTTPHHGLGQWNRTLLDTVYRLPSGYAPGDLVDTAAAGLNGGHAVRGLMVADLRAMASAARDAGVPLAVVSAYRSFARQETTFRRWVGSGGYEAALRTSARPGHSEHQLGTTLDLTSAGGADPWAYGDWGATPAGAWVARNSWRYGFVISYPRGSFARTCYSYEPWHVRYLGRERAAAIHASGLTPREVLWRLR